MCRVGWFLLVLLVVAGCSCNSDPSVPPRPADTPPLTPAVNLAETVILPHSDGPISPGVNYIYCATFQLAWAELAKNTVGSDIELEDGPPWIDHLGQGEFKQSDLSKDSYLAMGGLVSEGIVERIQAEMTKRFPNANVDVPQPRPDSDGYAFAYLTKSLTFARAFERPYQRLRWSIQGSKTSVATFGIMDYSELTDTEQGDELVEQVTILDYVSDSDFVLRLNPASQSDQIILAKVGPLSTLRETMEAVEMRIDNSSLTASSRHLQEGETLLVPIVQVSALRSYNEIVGRRFLNPGYERWFVTAAIQGIRFRLDEWGAELESHAYVGADGASTGGVAPRRFHFDQPFLLYLKKRSADDPYFAMWIENVEVLEPDDL